MPHEKYETPKILSDLPLVQGETASFHFDKFALTLARLIAYKKTRTPLTIGISGSWGTGKTTLLRRIKTMLDATPNIHGGTKPDDLVFVTKNEFAADEFRFCKTVWFDAWKYAGEDEILAALLRVIVTEMQHGSFWDKVKVELKKPKSEEVKWLGILLNALTAFASAGAYGVNVRDYIVDTPLKEASAFFDYFDDSFNRLLASWVGGAILGEKEINEEIGVLVIFIDDLDRCLPEKIIQVLEAVKLFLDKTGCVFVLGAHTDIIREAVKKHYIEQGLKEQDAADYLDKFIQLRFDLPPAPEEEMEAYVKQLADGSLAEHWRLVTIGAGYNPRKVKGFLNDLGLRWAVWKNVWQTGQVGYDDFVRWEVWMGSAPRFRLRVHKVYDKNDFSILNNLVEAAFLWAGGDENASAGFKEDATDSMRRVLREIQPYKARFTPEVLDSLLHLSLLPPKPEIKTETPVQEGTTGAGSVTLEPLGIKSEGKRIVPGEQDAITIGGIQFVRIPAGKFILGSKDDNPLASGDEKPQHTQELPEYWMAKFPLMNEQYAASVSQESHPVRGWENKKDHPVVNVSWKDAAAYCQWFNQQHKTELQQRDLTLHLPTEAQWEKAARGEYGNEWPWGNEFDEMKCNSGEGKSKGNTSPVNAYPQGESPYGVADMVGNVWEWTHSLFKPYPYNREDGREGEKDPGSRVLRGGSFSHSRRLARCAYRGYYDPGDRNDDFGFRVCASPISENSVLCLSAL